MAEEKKDDMDVDQDVSKKGPSGMGEPKSRDTEAGRADPSKMTNFSGATFEEYRKTAPTYEYSGEIRGSFPRTLRSTRRSPCLPKQRS